MSISRGQMGIITFTSCNSIPALSPIWPSCWKRTAGSSEISSAPRYGRKIKRRGKRDPFLWSSCVAPEYQRQKPDRVLIKHSFDVARKMGYDVKINFGNPGNYVSRGFVSCKKKNVSFVVDGNFPTALLVCELVPGVLDGRKWMYIPSTAADCCEDIAAVEAFDASFPAKEKAWMPSQEEFYIYSHSSVVR